jgi:hypothetical protein
MSDEQECPGATIEAIAHLASKSQTLPIEALAAGDVLTVQTQSGSRYSFRLVNPKSRLAIDVSERPPFWDVNEEVYVNGSLLGESSISLGNVLVCRNLEVIHAKRRDQTGLPLRMITSLVQAVSVNGVQLLPPPLSAQLKS